MTIDLPNVQVAVWNKSPDVDWSLYYGNECYDYPRSSITTVPMAVAHFHFGFEIDPQTNKLYRNTDEHYSDGEETQYRHTISTIMPWGDMNPRKDEDDAAERKANFKRNFEAYTKHIDAEIVRTPKQITVEQFNKMKSH